MPESLKNQFISDLYTSLLHLSGAELGAYGPINKVFDGAGNSTGIALSGKRVIINNYIYPKGYDTRPPADWLDAFFPIGCLQLTFDNNDPNTRIAGTTWGLVSEGRFLVGVGTYNDKNNDTYTFCPGTPPAASDSGNEEGEYRHRLDINEIPSHSHLTNTGSNEIQVPSPVGVGGIAESVAAAGKVNSTLSFAKQQQARNILANKIKWNFGSGLNDYGSIGSLPVPMNWRSPNPTEGYGEYLYPVKYGFDLNFLRGSARDSENPVFQNNANWQYKEMIGIWNGETRFISDCRNTDGAPAGVGRRNIPAQSSQNGLKNINWYDVCKDLGCVDISAADAGSILTEREDNKMQLITAPTNIVNNQMGAVNNRQSSIVGLGAPHNNIPPSYGVYVWKRLT